MNPNRPDRHQPGDPNRTRRPARPIDGRQIVYYSPVTLPPTLTTVSTVSTRSGVCTRCRNLIFAGQRIADTPTGIIHTACAITVAENRAA